MVGSNLQYEVKAFNSAKHNIQVHRPGLDVKFENRLHDDDVAKLFGFEAGLVPGVDLFAYLAHPAVERWGREFLDRGKLSGKFIKPVYEDDVVSVMAIETDAGLTLTAETRSEVCAVGSASLPDMAAPLPDWPSLDPIFPRPYKVPASENSLKPGDWLGCHVFETPEHWAAEFLKDMRETDDIYLREGLIHPGQIVRMLNWAVIDNVALAPWLYVGSTIQQIKAAKVGRPLAVRAIVTRNFEKKGHRLAELDGLILSDGAPVARGTHTVIYEPRQAQSAFRGAAVLA